MEKQTDTSKRGELIASRNLHSKDMKYYMKTTAGSSELGRQDTLDSINKARNEFKY